MKTKISAVLSPHLINANLIATNRWGALEELVELLIIHGKVDRSDKETVTAALKEREQRMTTGIGFGVAIPHASVGTVKNIVGAFGRSKHGIDFQALDQKLTNFILLLLIPGGQSVDYLAAMADFAKKLRESGLRSNLTQAPNAEAIYAILQS